MAKFTKAVYIGVSIICVLGTCFFLSLLGITIGKLVYKLKSDETCEINWCMSEDDVCFKDCSNGWCDNYPCWLSCISIRTMDMSLENTICRNYEKESDSKYWCTQIDKNVDCHKDNGSIFYGSSSLTEEIIAISFFFTAVMLSIAASITFINLSRSLHNYDKLDYTIL